jgi:hypothetical protein
MASKMRHVVEPLLGWMFVIAVMICVGGVFLMATRPRIDRPGPGKVEPWH